MSEINETDLHKSVSTESPSGDGGQPRKKRRRRRKKRHDGAGGTPDHQRGSGASLQAHDDSEAPEFEHHDDGDGEIFAKGKSFKDLGLRNSVLKGAHAAGFRRPTAIQAELIPHVLAGRDVLGQAKTGTGKTAAFGLPLLHMCDPNIEQQALVLAPTRELAIQIAAEINELGAFTPIWATPIYGGQRIGSQIEKLHKKPQIIVGTPGRVLDMINRGHLTYENIRFVILDEVDRMLDIGFREDIRRILKNCPEERQTVFVSATIAGEIEQLGRRYMTDPVKLEVAAGSLTVSVVTQKYFSVQPWDKRRLLKHLLTHEEPALTLVFCRLKKTVDHLARYLEKAGIDAHAIHADLPQGKRNAVMKKLREGQLAVLIASDLASRGIDVEGITHVINYDLPEDVELYVHRIGRTARAGRDGIAWSFVTPEQGELLTEIEKLINAEIPRIEYPDFVPGEPPEDVKREQESERARREQLAQQNRYAAKEPQAAAVDVRSEEELRQKFPGGIVPARLPPKRMQGRLRTRRR